METDTTERPDLGDRLACIVDPADLPETDVPRDPAIEAWYEADWETVKWALYGGQVVGVRCESAADARAALTAALYEAGGDLLSRYDSADGVLYLMRKDTVQTEGGEG